ncbi:MAG TPA: hypothetical protein DDZ51_09320 [Planctomycetaceae bacterium]|nr:hypothetical protein [Planctomycetaceae bacterium]
MTTTDSSPKSNHDSPDRYQNKIRYKEITKWFYDNSGEYVHPELERVLGNVMLLNSPVWEELERRKQFELADTLKVCHCMMATYRLGTPFRSTQYCRQPLLCMHCSKMQGLKRTQEILAACQRFSGRVNHRRLRMNQYLIVPNLTRWQLSPAKNFHLSYQLIKNFREELSSLHDTLSGRRMKTRMSLNVKKDLFGPTVNAIHVVPRGAGLKHYNANPQIHLHLTVVTIDRAPQRSVTRCITGLWERARTFAGLCHKAEKGEIIVRREYQHGKSKSPEAKELEEYGFRNKEFEISRFLDPLETEYADYKDDNLSVGTQLAFNHMLYVSRFLKQHWEPNHAVEHYNLVTKTLKLEPKQLRQFLGREGVKARRLPDSYDPQRLEQNYVAKLHDVHAARPWRVLKLVP